MSGKLITNDQSFLIDKMRNVIPNCENLYALVGYFYFSGFSKLSEDIKSKKMKILVGMDIDTLISGKLREISLIKKIDDERSDIEIRKEYYEKLTTLINETDSFDSSRQERELKLFMDKIKDGSLEIRKTREPNHAKMYVFENDKNHNENGDYLGVVVTGSSNFSYSGLAGRNEINVMFRDNRDFEEAKALFEKLWNNSVEIVGQYNKDDFFTEVKEKIWTEKIPAPILLFIRALSEYFSVKQDKLIKLPDEINKKYANFKYQSDAIQKALTVIERHNGVIVADVVGLGKSVIASAVAHNLKLPVIIIAPPHLTDQWENYRMQFNYNARVFSSGKIEEALNKHFFDEEYLIIIDEAARYRNPETKDYALLHKLCQGNKVILLTATPFNNNPEDVFALIQLFQIPAKSTIRTVQNLSGAFRELIKEYTTLQKLNRSGSIDISELKDEIRKISMKIRDIIFPVVIRRTRIDLDIIEEYRSDLQKQDIYFPVVNEPELATYNLGKLAPLYESTTEEIYPKKEEKENLKERFTGARYRPLSYLKPEALERMKKEMTQAEYRNLEYLIEGQKHIAGFMRTLLVRRFESSIEAFRLSVNSILSASDEMRKWFEKGKIPVRKRGSVIDVKSLLSGNGEELEMFSLEVNELLESLKEKGYNFFLSQDLNDDFIIDLKKDIKLLNKIRTDWGKVSADPKLEAFSNILKEQIRKEPDRKIIVFSEFADTVNYLFGKLQYGLRVMKYTSSDSTKENKKKIERNFDAGIEEKEKLNDFDILIATDAISEGYNLHRAGTIFNYDIPYNPTRVIQRIGRINRINRKMFDALKIYNYFPTDKGERETGIKTISTFKMAMIHALIGEDAKVLTNEEEVNRYFAEKLCEEKKAQEEESWDAKYRNLLYFIQRSDPGIFEAAKSLPYRSRVKRTKQVARSGVLVFGRKGDECSFKFSNSDGSIDDINIETAFKLMEADIAEKGVSVSENFDVLYQNAKNHLFTHSASSKGDKKQTETTVAIKSFINTNPEKREYLSELLYTVSTLKAIPENYMKMIRNIDSENEKEEIEALEKEIPIEYLTKIRKRAREIDGGSECIILAEELI